MSLRLYLTSVNQSRDTSEGVAPLDQADGIGKRELTAEDYEDVTDFFTPGFRYRM